MAFKLPLRDYQDDAVNSAILGFETEIPEVGGPYDRQLLVEPTGAGKTIMFAALADYWIHTHKQAVLILVDQIDLADQARDEILATTDHFPQIEQGDRTASPLAGIVIASVQTVANRLDKFARDRFGLVIADEADRSVADQWQKVLNHFDGHAKVLGVTATPDRNDQRSVLDYYERIAHETPLFELIKRGYLARIMVQTVPLSIDISKVKQSQGDYDKVALDEALTPYFGEVCEAIQKYAPDRKSLVFLPLIETSKRFVEVARDAGIIAEHIDGKSEERDEIKRRFRDGQIKLLANAMLLGRGYNDRSIDCIVNLRPTRSGSLYRQFVGRGTRTFCPHGCAERCDHKEAKQDLLLLDFLWTFHRLGLQRPANLIATSEEQAKKLTQFSERHAGKEFDLEGIDSKVALEAEKLLLKQLQKAAQKRPGFFDAMEFAVYFQQRELVDYVSRSKWEQKPVSEGQANYLDKLGIDSKTVKDFGHAHAILDAATARRKKGLASIKQVKLLRRFGVNQPELVTFEGAKAWLDFRLNGVPLPAGLNIYMEGAENPTPEGEEAVSIVDTDEGAEIVETRDVEPPRRAPEPSPEPASKPLPSNVRIIEPKSPKEWFEKMKQGVLFGDGK